MGGSAVCWCRRPIIRVIELNNRALYQYGVGGGGGGMSTKKNSRQLSLSTFDLKVCVIILVL